MRSAALVVLLLAGCGHDGKPSTMTEPTPTTAWATIASDAGVTVDVERALFELAGEAHFFVHVRIASTRALAVDLRGYHDVLYPNQWGASATPQRQVIDERRVVLPPFDPAPVLAAHAAGALVPVSGTLDYYEEFNASGRADVDAQIASASYVIVTMDGQLRVSDGKTAERIVPAADPAREVAIAVPLTWRQVPPGARVIRSR